MESAKLKHLDKLHAKAERSYDYTAVLVNDDSFAKMDERRVHDVFHFIRDCLWMQLNCAIPTKHAGVIKTEFIKEWSLTRTPFSTFVVMDDDRAVAERGVPDLAMDDCTLEVGLVFISDKVTERCLIRPAWQDGISR